MNSVFQALHHILQKIFENTMVHDRDGVEVALPLWQGHLNVVPVMDHRVFEYLLKHMMEGLGRRCSSTFFRNSQNTDCIPFVRQSFAFLVCSLIFLILINYPRPLGLPFRDSRHASRVDYE